MPEASEMIAKMYEEMKKYLINTEKYNEKEFTISYQYNYYGAIGVIKEWLMDGCKEEPGSLGNTLYAIVEKQYR